jgi:cysteine protease ATG4
MLPVSGFDVIADSKLTSDVNWGCMVRSSQMLVAQVNSISLKVTLYLTRTAAAVLSCNRQVILAFILQALIFHHLGRSWRKPPEKVRYIT